MVLFYESVANEQEILESKEELNKILHLSVTETSIGIGTTMRKITERRIEYKS